MVRITILEKYHNERIITVELIQLATWSTYCMVAQGIGHCSV